MKLTPWYLVAIAPIAVAGCSGALFGQCAVLVVTLCIFVGTLSLGRHTAVPTPAVNEPVPLFGGAPPPPAPLEVGPKR
jgi:hypothetical protein